MKPHFWSVSDQKKTVWCQLPREFNLHSTLFRRLSGVAYANWLDTVTVKLWRLFDTLKGTSRLKILLTISLLKDQRWELWSLSSNKIVTNRQKWWCSVPTLWIFGQLSPLCHYLLDLRSSYHLVAISEICVPIFLPLQQCWIFVHEMRSHGV